MILTSIVQWVVAWRDQKGEEVGVHSAKLYDIARQLLEDRKVNPLDVEEDPASSLLAERVDGKPLEEVHVLGCIRQALVVGMVVRLNALKCEDLLLMLPLSGSADLAGFDM